MFRPFIRKMINEEIAAYKIVYSHCNKFCKKKDEIPVSPEIQFSKKERRNETMKNEANQCRFFLENQILRRTGIFIAKSDC